MSSIRFKNYVESAIGKLQEAESSITYLDTERNKETIIEIQKMIDKLEDFLDREDIG
jgi:flagellin-specific chaperone FliS